MFGRIVGAFFLWIVGFIIMRNLLSRFSYKKKNLFEVFVCLNSIQITFLLIGTRYLSFGIFLFGSVGITIIEVIILLLKKENRNYEIEEAFLGDDIALATKLINNGLDVNACIENRLLLEHAIALATKLINNGLDVNACIENRLLLEHAIEKGLVDIVKLLIEKGAKVPLSAVTEKGYTDIIKLLVEKGYIDIAKLLIEKGAKVPLSIVIEEGYTDVAKLLIEKGAKVPLEDVIE